MSHSLRKTGSKQKESRKCNQDMRWHGTLGLSMVARALHGLQFGLLRAEAVPHGSSSGTLGRSTAPHCCFFLVVCRLLSSPGFLCFGFLSPPLALLRRCDIYKKRRGRGRRPVPRSRAIAEAYALWKTFNLSMGWCCCCRRGGKAISSSTRARDGAGGVSTLNTLDILFRLIKRTPCRSREGKETDVRLLRRGRSNAVWQLAGLAAFPFPVLSFISHHFWWISRQLVTVIGHVLTCLARARPHVPSRWRNFGGPSGKSIGHGRAVVVLLQARLIGRN